MPWPAAFAIAGRPLGAPARCFVIAEAGVNHNGDVRLARELIAAAAAAGADAVKFQTFQADLVAGPEAPKAGYQLAATPAGQSQQAMLRALELPRDAHAPLAEAARTAGLIFLSTPFDLPSVALLVELGVPAFKVASGELTHDALLVQVARAGRPVLLSTGMATLGEVERAAALLEAEGAPALALLHCVSQYPADPADANLRAMATLKAAFGVPVGFSDHTTGIEVALAAAALGAELLEKHFTLDHRLPGPDHRASLEPGELSALVRGIRAVEAAQGDGLKRPRPCEADTRRVGRRSLAVARDLPAGTVLTADMIVCLRPATGLAPDQLPLVLGRRTRVALRRGQVLTAEALGEHSPHGARARREGDAPLDRLGADEAADRRRETEGGRGDRPPEA